MEAKARWEDAAKEQGKPLSKFISDVVEAHLLVKYESPRSQAVEEASISVNSVLNTRDKTILTLLFTTGMCIGELTKLGVSDMDLSKGTITLKNTAKQSNRVLFVDGETINMLIRWLTVKNAYTGKDTEALFICRDVRAA